MKISIEDAAYCGQWFRDSSRNSAPIQSEGVDYFRTVTDNWMMLCGSFKDQIPFFYLRQVTMTTDQSKWMCFQYPT